MKVSVCPKRNNLDLQCRDADGIINSVYHDQSTPLLALCARDYKTF